MKTIIFFLSLILFTSTKAEWHQGIGNEYFGTETSEKTACKAAEDKALKQILHKTVGESISVSDFQLCNDQAQTDKSVCKFLSTAINSTEGRIVGLKILNREIKSLQGTKQCSITIAANIKKEKGLVDYSFNPDIKLNQTRFKEGEPISITINSKTPFYLNIFIPFTHLSPLSSF